MNVRRASVHWSVTIRRTGRRRAATKLLSLTFRKLCGVNQQLGLTRLTKMLIECVQMGVKLKEKVTESETWASTRAALLPGMDSPSLCNSAGGMNAKSYSFIWCFFFYDSDRKHCVTHFSSPLPLVFSWDLVTVKAVAYDSHYFHRHRTVQWPLVPFMEASFVVFNLSPVWHSVIARQYLSNTLKQKLATFIKITFSHIC